MTPEAYLERARALLPALRQRAPAKEFQEGGCDFCQWAVLGGVIPSD